MTQSNPLRMRDLEARTGVPRTAIHHYLREGVLPQPERPTRNSAIYSERHVQLLEAVARLREPPLGPLPTPSLRRVIALVARGVELDVAVALHRAVLGDLPTDDLDRTYDTPGLAKALGADSSVVEQLVAAGLLVPSTNEDPDSPVWDGLDLVLGHSYLRLLRVTGLAPADAAFIGPTIRELSRREMQLRNQAVRGLAEHQRARVSQEVQEGINLVHRYLFYRWRLRDIAETADLDPAGVR